MPQKKSSAKPMTRKQAAPKATSTDHFGFEQAFPAISEWVSGGGWVEIGQQDDFGGAYVRALDPGGMAWEGKFSYPSLDDALRDLEDGLKKWMAENG